MTPKERAIVKYNGGKGAFLCSGCRVIIKDGNYTEEEKQYLKGKIKYLPPYYCNKCKGGNK